MHGRWSDTSWIISGDRFMDQVAQPTVSEHQRKTVGRQHQAPVPPEPLHRVTMNKLKETASKQEIVAELTNPFN